ncbi:MAG TPA: hypothetical protein VK559_01735 [Ferruginibacter sp.]|nr:hypothetical protein [Ferruginibacter sp.]
MKIFSIFSISVLSVFHSFAQINAGKSIYPHLDTISIYYPSPTFDTAADGCNRYYDNGQRIDKKTSDIYLAQSAKINDCKPCVLKTNRNNGLISTAVQYGNGLVGFYISYYPNGKMKMFGHYKENPTGDWTNIYERGYSYVKEGKWIYYNTKGKIVKTEFYIDNKLQPQKK